MADRVELVVTGLEGVLETLKQLPPEVVSKRGGPVKLALAKGARMLRDAARTSFAAAVAEPGKSGETNSTGFTAKQIITKRGRMKRGEKGERYYITVRAELHPSGKAYRRKSRRKADSTRRKRKIKANAVTANDVAFLMEYGSKRQPATPWLRPAAESNRQQIAQSVTDDLNRRIDRITKKLARQNRGRR